MTHEHERHIEPGDTYDLNEGKIAPGEPREALPRYLRREFAAHYIRDRWGLPCQPSWLAKLAVVGGGPPFRKCGRYPMYETATLDAWAQSRLSVPMRSTSDAA